MTPYSLLEYNVAEVAILLIAILGCVFVGWLLWTCHSIHQMERRCDLAFKGLADAIAKEHLIIEHLLDSLPSDFEASTQSRVSVFCQRTSRALAQLRDDSNSRTLAESLSQTECELGLATDRLVEQIQKDESIANRATVAGCMRGLTDAKTQAYAAMLTYNQSAITMSAFARLLLPGMACKIIRRDLDRRSLIDWTPDVSS
ncbi:hypothetical protein [Novipirellula artificiosorum]|uniref:LemA family protein n=1 Tax=Novipirellula artificiosorum TaxID=2528016 RepID=A0A5C6DF40_9BACT|nr:hypothetical protein [Novipirellula artificiosorum]TWU34361.1 hypothetical protein Poly41_45080 [Novipirellula artificiosorum]